MTESFYPLVGGGESQAAELAASLVTNGFSVIVVTRRLFSSLPNIEHLSGVTICRLPPVGMGHLKKWGLMLFCFPMLFRLRGSYDIILVSGFRVLGIAGVIMSKVLGKYCILKADNLGEASGQFFAPGLALWGLRHSSRVVRLLIKCRDVILRRSDAFVAISTEVGKELESYLPSEKVVHMIPNGVNSDRFRPISAEEKQLIRHKLGMRLEGRIVTFTGRLVSYKGLPLLLSVWEEIQQKHPGVSLFLVGSGGLDIHNCEEALKEYVRLKSLQHTVHFIGAVHNVVDYLQASDIFVFPTEREAFGISLIEAMACGLPVISTSIGVGKEIIQHGQNGLVVKPRDFKELYEALDRLLADEALASSLGQAARACVEERYSIKSVTAKYIELIKSLARPNVVKAFSWSGARKR